MANTPKRPLKKLDHIAIVVKDTDEALRFYRDTLGLSVAFSEVLEDQAVRLTHLDMGNVQLQLVQPMREDHPLKAHLAQHGEGLHHLCFEVDVIPAAVSDLTARGMPSRDAVPRSAPNGRRSVFLDPARTRGVLWELTGKAQ
jgi:methylmalonyl-CoA/ethylmalonyl-CoA epimerase